MGQDCDYTTVTELPGHRILQEQMERLYQRYYFASRFCGGKGVLEAACGAGVGLGIMAKTARQVVGGDINKTNLTVAQEYYKYRANLDFGLLDAHSLPFADNSFDVVVLYEAIYYLAWPERFIAEAHRILRPGGTIILGTANKDWSDFNPSPFSTRYFSAPELYQLLKQKFPQVEIYGAFPASTNSARGRLVSVIKKTAVRLNLMPKTMRGKELFKRIFFGQLMPLPAEITDGMAGYYEPAPISGDAPDSRHKVLYAVAHA